jgi:hypothetical protein
MDRELVREVAASSVAAVSMFVVTVNVAGRISWLELGSLARAGWLVCCLGIGVGVYLTVATILGCKGVKTLTKRFISM